jgi:hypothetical protein
MKSCFRLVYVGMLKNLVSVSRELFDVSEV